MVKIDVRRHVEAMERLLRADEDPTRCQEALVLLRRWQFDKMLDEASRDKAKTLVREFASKLTGRMHQLR